MKVSVEVGPTTVISVSGDDALEEALERQRKWRLKNKRKKRN